MRKNRKLYVVISLVAIVGLVLSSVVGIFAGVGDFSPIPEQTRQEESPDLQETITRVKVSAEQLAEALQNNPDNIFLLTELGNTYFHIGKLYFVGQEDLLAGVASFEKAVEVYEKILAIEPGNVAILIEKALAAYHAGDNDLAGETFRKAIDQDPSHPYAHYGYAFFLYYAMGDAVGAISSLEKVLELREGFDPEKYPVVSEALFDAAANFLQHVTHSLEKEETSN